MNTLEDIKRTLKDIDMDAHTRTQIYEALDRVSRKHEGCMDLGTLSKMWALQAHVSAERVLSWLASLPEDFVHTHLWTMNGYVQSLPPVCVSHLQKHRYPENDVPYETKFKSFVERQPDVGNS